MPAMLDDPTAPTIYRTSGLPPYPSPHDPNPSLPADVFPRQVTLRDRITTATLIPFSSRHQVPASLLAYLAEQLNKEIDMGDTYPMIEPMSVEKFSSYWFQNFGAVMLLGNIESADEVVEGKNWAVECLGSYYIKPNYPGRSSHVCNAGFLVTAAARNRGVGRLMGESYLEWAPRLGYSYSVFNLVYETNVASCRIWDALGFKRIGKVKGAGNMKSYPGQLIDAIIYGRDLGADGEDFVSEERFDKIKFYLKYAKYPAGADRAEKSRLRSAATHYKLLVDEDKLMLKDKEVISDPQKQYEIARNVHVLQHGGINKTTATIAEKYHWVRIKETVSLVIRNCTACKELGKAPVVRAADGVIRPPVSSRSTIGPTSSAVDVKAQSNLTTSDDMNDPAHTGFQGEAGQGSVSPQVLNRALPPSSVSSSSRQPQLQHSSRLTQQQSDEYMPLDPQIMEDVRNHLGHYNNQGLSHAPDPSHLNQSQLPNPHDQDTFNALVHGGHRATHPSSLDADREIGVDLDTDEEEDEDADGEIDGDLDMILDDEAGAVAQLRHEAGVDLGKGGKGFGR